MEAICSSEIWVQVHEATWRHIPEHSALENMIFHSYLGSVTFFSNFVISLHTFIHLSFKKQKTITNEACYNFSHYLFVIKISILVEYSFPTSYRDVSENWVCCVLNREDSNETDQSKDTIGTNSETCRKLISGYVTSRNELQTHGWWDRSWSNCTTNSSLMISKWYMPFLLRNIRNDSDTEYNPLFHNIQIDVHFLSVPLFRFTSSVSPSQQKFASEIFPSSLWANNNNRGCSWFPFHAALPNDINCLFSLCVIYKMGYCNFDPN
jgi:hypothetical protein